MPRDPDKVLRSATVVFAVAFMGHNLDHLRRGFSTLTGAVLAGGTVLAIGSVIAIVLVARRHPFAPTFAMYLGVPGAIGVAATHLLPTWSALSDSFPDGHVDGWSWAAAIFEIVGLLLLAGAGFYASRSGRVRVAVPVA